MKRSFSSKKAKEMREYFFAIDARLRQIGEQDKSYFPEIKAAAVALRNAEIWDRLKGVPIEEINREKRGIKVKTLRDSGYKTIADIAPRSEYQIASIYGISRDTAHTIYRIVQNIVRQTEQNTRIRLSTDQQSPQATRLVLAVASLLRVTPIAERSKDLRITYAKQISSACDDLVPGTSGIRWFFASEKRQRKSEEAYHALCALLDGYYGSEVQSLIERDSKKQSITPRQAWQDFEKNSVKFFNVLESIVPELMGSDDSVYGLPEDLAREIYDEAFFPDGLLCDLRSYQVLGVKYILHQGRVLLGDEMGLGKTIQAIATMVSLKNTKAKHFMVVCPLSVLANWCREISTKSKLMVTKIHGADRNQALKEWIRTGGVAVTTYETTGSLSLNPSFQFSMLIVDEAHYIKNPEANRTIHVKEIADHAERLLFLTGTALENKVDEMVSLIEILQPQVANQVKWMQFLSEAPEFRRKVAPVYYRRKREDVLTELPEKIEEEAWCSLFPEEEAIYEQAVLSKRYADARRVSWSVDDLNKSSKAMQMKEIIEDAENEGRKVIVFSYFLDTIWKIAALLGRKCMSPITGSVSAARRQEIIDEFDKAPAGTVLVAQIQSGGTGLNIQSASVVILCEPQLKPSIENQAISRAYRMGQTRNVLVFRLLCQNTVDERIMDMLEQKQQLFNAFADKSEAAKESLELDSKSFGEIIQQEIDRINAKHSNNPTQPNTVSGAGDSPHAGQGTVPCPDLT